MNEVWKAVTGFEGKYEVSDLGRVKALPKVRFDAGPRRNAFACYGAKILRPGVVGGGYLQVWLYRDGEKQGALVHRLVAKAFIPNPENKPDVNHKDGVKANCRKGNLKWETKKENNDHAMKTGLTLPGSNAYKGKVAIGTRHGYLTVIGPISHEKRVLCRCDCGSEKEVSRFNLGRSVKSCGCAKFDSSMWSKQLIAVEAA